MYIFHCFLMFWRLNNSLTNQADDLQIKWRWKQSLGAAINRWTCWTRFKCWPDDGARWEARSTSNVIPAHPEGNTNVGPSNTCRDDSLSVRRAVKPTLRNVCGAARVQCALRSACRVLVTWVSTPCVTFIVSEQSVSESEKWTEASGTPTASTPKSWRTTNWSVLVIYYRTELQTGQYWLLFNK